jgi:hypothetical protein
MPPKVQHDDVPTLAICHATMQVMPVRLAVDRTPALAGGTASWSLALRWLTSYR